MTKQRLHQHCIHLCSGIITPLLIAGIVLNIGALWGASDASPELASSGAIYIDFVTALYMQGKGVLKISDNGRQIEGVFTNLSTGLVTTAILYR